MTLVFRAIGASDLTLESVQVDKVHINPSAISVQ